MERCLESIEHRRSDDILRNNKNMTNAKNIWKYTINLLLWNDKFQEEKVMDTISGYLEVNQIFWRQSQYCIDIV